MKTMIYCKTENSIHSFFMENEGEKRYNKHLDKRVAAVDRKAASAAEKGSRSGPRCESGRLGCA